MRQPGTITLDRSDNDKLRAHCEHRFRAMMPGDDLVRDAYEIAGFCMPERSRALVEQRKRKHKTASGRMTLYDGYAMRSFETCANGMLSGLSSRSRPWRKSTLEDDALMRAYGVRVWLDGYDKLVYSALGASNFYEAMLACYTELAGFGTAAVVFQENDAHSPKFVAHAMTFGEYGIAVGADLRPNALARAYTMTAQQMVDAFVADQFDSTVMHWDRVSRHVREAWDGGHYERMFQVHQLIEPNPAYVPGRIGRIGMPFRSIKWEPGQKDKKAFLEIRGYRSQPFAAPRWETVSAEVWGTGRGKRALPDMRELQLQAKRKGQATDKAISPPTFGPPSLDRINILPGQHTVMAAADMAAGIQPIYQVPYQAIGVLAQDVAEVRRAIDRATYADLFMAITNMEGVQPRNIEELARRHEEQLTQLGPVTDRVNCELLQVATDRIGDILTARGDVLNMLPDPPEELQGSEIHTDFVSVLTQAQRMMGISQTERAVAFVGNLAAAFPEAADNLDVDAVVGDYWERVGAVSSGLRDPKARDALRAQRAAQQQAQQMAASMPAVRDGADAARLLSEADTGAGDSMLQRLVG